jgi:pyruvate,water dikinase
VNTGEIEPETKRAPTSTTGLGRLAKAVADSEVLYDRVGQVASRGVAVGPVFNLETGRNPDAFPEGAVLVATDIVPDDDLIRLMRQASAILTDFGESAGDTATLARESKIPTIVGLKDASKRLQTGTEITVDADENAVYLGRIPALLEYYDAERPGHEETEYRILRRLRRFMFPLTLEQDAGSGAELGDCGTLHDLVHLAHELAGTTHVEHIAGFGDLGKESTEIATSSGIPLCVVDVGGALIAPAPDLGGPDSGEIRSLPLRKFVLGMDQMIRKSPRAIEIQRTEVATIATATEEHANIVVRQINGFDIVDSMIGDSKESNHIYCRFAAQASDAGGETTRGAVTREVLSKLNFAAARTARATAAWLSGVPRTEMEECLTIVGRLCAYLLEMDASGWDAKSKDRYVEDFMVQHV